MAQTFKETAHLRVDQEKFNEGYERIYGKKDVKKDTEQDEKTRIKELAISTYRDLDGGQDTEGFPESSSFIYGFVQGYKAAKEGK